MEKIFKENDSNNLQSTASGSIEDSIFSTVFNNNQAIMLLVDPENNQKILDANEAALKFYGYTRKQILQLDMGCINTSSEEERYKMMKQAIQMPDNNFQFEHKTSTGILKTVEVNASPIIYKNKKVMFIIVHDITELKTIEEALKESEERFELALAGTELGLWDLRVQTSELHVNERWAAIFGYTLKELSPITNNTWRENSHPEDIKKADRLFHKYLRKEIDSYGCEVRMRHKDGSWVWIYTMGKVSIWSEDGKPIRMSGTHLDITEKKNAESKLAESEVRFRSYFESSPLSIWEQDCSYVISYLNDLPVSGAEGLRIFLDKHPEEIRKCSELMVILDVNPSTLSMYGARSKEHLFKNLKKIFTDESFEFFKEKLVSLYNKQTTFSGESVHRTISGKIMNVSQESILLPNLRNFVTITDITGRKNAELKLRNSEEKFRSYFESSPLSLWEEDHTDVVKYLHSLPVSGAEELLSYLNTHPDEVRKSLDLVKILNLNQSTLDLYEADSKDQMIRGFLKIFTPSTFEAFKAELISLYKNEPSIACQFTDSTLTGKKIDVKLEMIQLLDNKYLTTITDITESKNRELELRELLFQTKADAETKEILLREINHRVKNNLSSFIGMLYAEKKHSGRELKEAQMEHVDSLINRLKGISIAHDLLSRSKWAPVSLFTLSEKIVHSLNHLIPPDRFIKTEITPSSVFLDADQSNSMAVVINELFTNCIKHASNEGDEIKIKIEIKEKKGKITYIYSDNGPGFSEKVLNSESYNVGLYLIKNIVEQSLQGTVKMENEDGARVTLQFPGGIEFEEL